MSAHSNNSCLSMSAWAIPTTGMWPNYRFRFRSIPTRTGLADLVHCAVQIRVAAQTAVLVKKLRLAWNGLLQDKVNQGSRAFSSAQDRIVATIVELLSEDL